MNKTTSENFKQFCNECSYWITYFGLLEYRFHFFHTMMKKDKCLAMTKMHSDDSAKIVMLHLNVNWGDDEINEFMVRQSGFHEVMEVLLYGIRQNLGQGYANWHIHTMIRIFENTIFHEHYHRRFNNAKKATGSRKKH